MSNKPHRSEKTMSKIRKQMETDTNTGFEDLTSEEQLALADLAWPFPPGGTAKFASTIGPHGRAYMILWRENKDGTGPLYEFRQEPEETGTKLTLRKWNDGVCAFETTETNRKIMDNKIIGLTLPRFLDQWKPGETIPQDTLDKLTPPQAAMATTLRGLR